MTRHIKYEIIDVRRKGNLLRLYLGLKDDKWGYTNPNYKNKNIPEEILIPSDCFHGDDWSDVPYEHNAGLVYDEFVKGYVDCLVPFDFDVFEPCYNTENSKYSKNDFVFRKVPCLVIGRLDIDTDMTYEDIMTRPDVFKVFFKDDVERLENSKYVKILNKVIL